MVTLTNGIKTDTLNERRTYAHVVGWGMAVPENVLSNHDLEAFLDTSDEWIVSRTGIKERRIASERESTATLGLKAAQRALEKADILPAELDLIIVATSTPENTFPSTASLIQGGLGATSAGAFDLSAACSGFVYATNMAAQAIRSGSMQSVLVVGAETMTRVMDWQDRRTCILFGDGAGAIVLTASNTPGGVLSAVLRSDGSGYDVLGVPTVGSIDSCVPVGNLNNGHRLHKMHMNGGETFRFATRVIGESIIEALDKAGLAPSDVDLIVPHQANARIIQSAARTLGLSEEQFMVNIDRYGNTSAASIPIALCEAVETGRIEPGNTIAFVGFGGGLAWGAMVIQWREPLAEVRQGTIINRQRRKFSYFAARARVQTKKVQRWFYNATRRVRPRRGRVHRLRRKVDQHDLR